MEGQIRKLGRKFAEQELRKRWEELDSRNPNLLKGILKKSKDIGIFSFLLSPEIDSTESNLKNYSIFLEEISRGCAGIGVVFVFHLMGITPIYMKRNKFLFSITQSEKENNPSIFTLAIYEEKFSKLIPDNIQTIVKPRDGNYIISGNKINVLGAEIASYFTLLARLENSEKFALLIVPSNSEGIEIKEGKNMMGLKICPVNDIYFNNVEISQENILDEDIKPSDLLNYYQFFDSSLAVVSLGIAEESYNIALKYTTERYQGGKIICEHDAVKMMLAEMALYIEIVKNLVYNNVSKSILTSAFASEVAEKVCISAIQLLGGYGYMKDFKLERLLRDAKTYQAIINPRLRKMEYIEDKIRK